VCMSSLREDEINRLAEEFLVAYSKGGPSDLQTADARARCESLLGRWEQATVEAADREDYDEFERLCNVLTRIRETLENPGATPSSSTSPSTTPPTPAGSSIPFPNDVDSGKETKRSKRRHKKNKNDLPSPVNWGSGSGGDFGGDKAFGDSSHDDSSRATGVERMGELEREVEQLHAQVDRALQADMAAESSAGVLSERLKAALRRLKELESVEAAVKDADTSLKGMVEANSQLRQELENTREELCRAKSRSVDAEAQIAIREELLTQTRRKLFDIKARNAHLEDEIKDRSGRHSSVHGELEDARARHSATARNLEWHRQRYVSQRGAAGGSFPVPPTAVAAGPSPLERLARQNRRGTWE